MQDNTHEHIDEALVQRGWMAMQQQLDAAMPVQQKRKRRVLAWWWTVSAAAALLLLVGGYVWWSVPTPVAPTPHATALPDTPSASREAAGAAPGRLATTQGTNRLPLDMTAAAKAGVRAVPQAVPTNRAVPSQVDGAAVAMADHADAAGLQAPPPAMRVESAPLNNATTPLLVGAPIAPLLVPVDDAGLALVPAPQAKRWRGYAAVAGGLDLGGQRPLAALSVGAARQWGSGWGLDAAVGYQRHVASFGQDTDLPLSAGMDGAGTSPNPSHVILIDETTLRYSRVQAGLTATYRILPRVQVGLGLQGCRYLTAVVDAQYPVMNETTAGSGNLSNAEQNGSLNLFDSTNATLRNNFVEASASLGAPVGRWSAGVVADVSVLVSSKLSVQVQYQRTLTDWPFAAQRTQALLLGVRYGW